MTGGAVWRWPSGHGDHAFMLVGQFVVYFQGDFVIGSAVAGAGWVAGLDHETFYHPVELHVRSVVKATVDKLYKVFNRFRRSFRVKLYINGALLRVDSGAQMIGGMFFNVTGVGVGFFRFGGVCLFFRSGCFCGLGFKIPHGVPPGIIFCHDCGVAADDKHH